MNGKIYSGLLRWIIAENEVFWQTEAELRALIEDELRDLPILLKDHSKKNEMDDKIEAQKLKFHTAQKELGDLWRDMNIFLAKANAEAQED